MNSQQKLSLYTCSDPKVFVAEISSDLSIQEKEIIAQFLEADEGWVSSATLSRLAKQYNTRLHALRFEIHPDLGFDIRSERRSGIDGYKLYGVATVDFIRNHVGRSR